MKHFILQNNILYIIICFIHRLDIKLVFSNYLIIDGNNNPLCTNTCQEQLTEPNLSVQRTHGLLYPEVLDLWDAQLHTSEFILYFEVCMYRFLASPITLSTRIQTDASLRLDSNSTGPSSFPPVLKAGI